MVILLVSNSICPVGGRHAWVTNLDGETSCKKCGMVSAERQEIGVPFSLRPEAITGPENEYKLGSWIGKNPKEAKKIPGSTYFSDFDLVLRNAKRWIKAYTQKVSSQEIVSSRTLELFKESRKILRGKDTKTFVAACLHIACREQEIPSSPIFIATIANVKRDKLVKFEKQVCKLLDITLPPDKAAKKVRYVATKIGIKESISRKAIKILDRIPSFETGPDPKGIAAAVLYLVCEDTKYSVTHKQLAAVTLLNSQTIGNSIRRLRNDLKKYKIKIR